MESADADTLDTVGGNDTDDHTGLKLSKDRELAWREGAWRTFTAYGGPFPACRWGVFAHWKAREHDRSAWGRPGTLADTHAMYEPLSGAMIPV
jgi:hypothetical protein